MYTAITANVELNAGSGWSLYSATCYFHPQDISVILSQPNAISCQMENARINGTDCLVLIAVTQVDPITKVATKRLDQLGNMIAVSCPPFLEQGGVFNPNPVL